MVKSTCQKVIGSGQSANCEVLDSDRLFENLIWMTTEEAARYLRKSPNAIRIMVHKQVLKARKFRRRLYFKRCELDSLIETSFIKGGY